MARKLTHYDPDDVQWWISWAYATRRWDSIESAKSILLTALKKLPLVALIPYNLACYECLLGELEAAISSAWYGVVVAWKLRSASSPGENHSY